MDVVETRDRGALAAFLRRRGAWHAYALADLDDFFFDATRWFAAVDGDGIRAACLLLDKLAVPILYAVAPPDDADTAALLRAVEPELPPLAFANLGLGLERALRSFAFDSHGEHWKMELARGDLVDAVDAGGVEPLGPGDLDELRDFYRLHAYAPGERADRFFEPYMLETGAYRALRRRGALAAVAGVHVLSTQFGVAAVGNVATRPQLRGRGLARATSAAVCRSLRDRVDLVALNVHTDNAPALRCYERLGFRRVCRYVEGCSGARRARRPGRSPRG